MIAPSGRQVLGGRGAAVFFDEFPHDGEPQSRPFLLGRDVGFEDSGQSVRLDARPVVGHRDFREGAVSLQDQSCPDDDDATAATFERFLCIADEVVQQLPQPHRIGVHFAHAVVELQRNGRLPALVTIQPGNLADELVQVHPHQVQRRRAGIFTEGVDHVPHRLDLLHDRMGRAFQHLAILRRHDRQVTAPDAFGGQTDGRERVLDLVCEAARHLAPGGVALRLQQLGDVVEDDDDATGEGIVHRSRRARAVQDAADVFAAELDLAAPVDSGIRHVGLPRLQQL